MNGWAHYAMKHTTHFRFNLLNLTASERSVRWTFVLSSDVGIDVIKLSIVCCITWNELVYSFTCSTLCRTAHKCNDSAVVHTDTKWGQKGQMSQSYPWLVCRAVSQPTYTFCYAKLVWQRCNITKEYPIMIAVIDDLEAFDSAMDSRQRPLLRLC